MTEYRRGNDHVYRLIAGEHLLIALRRDTVSPVFSFSDTAAEIWAAMADWATIPALISHIVERFEVDAEVAATDVSFFLEQLRSVGALQTRETS
jgi:hypothetical protein